MFLRPNPISVPLFGITQGRGAPRKGMGAARQGGGAPRQGRAAPSSKFLGVRSQPSPCPCPGHGDEASGRNILLSLAVLEPVCAHPQFPLPEVFGQNKRSWGKMELQPFGGGTKPGPAGQCILRIPKFPRPPRSAVGHWDCRHQRGSLMACARGICSFPLPPRLSVPN